jgi:hypothetical protein
MAKLSLNTTEPMKIIHLVESLFPGTDLKAIEKVLEGVTLQGNMTVNKKINATETVTLLVEITGA